jgi:hypothetical protein
MKEKDSPPEEQSKTIVMDYGVFGKVEVIDLSEELSTYAMMSAFSTFRY